MAPLPSDILTPARLSWALGIIALSLIVRFFQKLHFHRSLVKGLPQPPHSYLFGHLPAMGKVIATQPRRAAPQTYAILIKEKYNLPDYFVTDVWPMADPILNVFDADIMHQFVVKQSLPKHPEVDKFLQHFGGPGNLVSSEGAEWKKWRSAFSPGFSAAHLMSLVPVIVEECEVFCDILTKHAKGKEVFRMERDTTRLTVDIIGKVALDHALDSQKAPNELVDTFMSQCRWQGIGPTFNPIEVIDWPLRMVMQNLNDWKMDRYIGRQLEQRFATREGRGKSKAIVDLALEAYLKEVKGAKGEVDVSKVKGIDPEFKKAMVNNMKTFIFAGHDTTSSTICYAFYYLSKNPECLAKIRKEHDEVFGTDVNAVADLLREDARLLNKLEYTLAVTREVLRLQPPASTIRMGQKGVYLHDPKTNEPIPTEHFMLWPVDVGLHRSARYWPDPHTFRPERHLPSKTTSCSQSEPDQSANFTSNPAWVAFSKGIRNCIGQELAIIETKAILAMTLRRFEFRAAFDELEKLRVDGTGYPSDSSGVQEQFGDEAYQIQLGTAKPREGMPCRVSLRG